MFSLTFYAISKSSSYLLQVFLSDEEVTGVVRDDGVRCRVKHAMRVVILIIDIIISVKTSRILFDKIRGQYVQKRLRSFRND